MFKWLAKQFTREDEDTESLGSEAGLRAFIEGLPTVQPQRTVEAIGEPFENARTLELRPDRLRHALLRIDEHAQAPLAEVWARLFDGKALSDSHWLVLARYYRNVHAGYRFALESVPDRSSLSESDRADLNLVAVRAMQATARHKLLLRMRYRDVDGAYWAAFNALAAEAAATGSHATLLDLYPDTGVQSSVEREQLSALAFEVAPIANLLPEQMFALDLVLRRYTSNYFFTAAARDTAPFGYEPARNEAARRWLKGLPPRPGTQFFGIGNAYAQIAGLRKAARASREVPEWIAPTRCGHGPYVEMLDLLVAHWSTDPPQRRSRRDQRDGEILAVHGLAMVRRMIAASEYARTGGRLGYQENTPYDAKLFSQLKFGTVGDKAATAQQPETVTPMEILSRFELGGDRQMTERWTVTDESAGGVGVVAHAHAGWAKVGMLVGYRESASLDWQLALIRRLNRTAQGKLSVGLQRLAGSTHCARIRIGDDTDGHVWAAVTGDNNAYHDAILLRDEGTTLLIDQGLFKAPLECHLSYDKRWHPIRIERSVEQGLDYERVAMSFLATPR